MSSQPVRKTNTEAACALSELSPAGGARGCRGGQRPAAHPQTLLCCRYFENIPKGLDREGWTRGGIQPQKPGGYTLSHPVTRMEATPNPAETLRHLHPHVGR